MSAMRMPAQLASGTPRVMRNDWNGPRKSWAKKTTQIVPTVRITPSTAAAAGRGMLMPSVSSVRPDE